MKTIYSKGSFSFQFNFWANIQKLGTKKYFTSFLHLIILFHVFNSCLNFYFQKRVYEMMKLTYNTYFYTTNILLHTSSKNTLLYNSAFIYIFENKFLKIHRFFMQGKLNLFPRLKTFLKAKPSISSDFPMISLLTKNFQCILCSQFILSHDYMSIGNSLKSIKVAFEEKFPSKPSRNNVRNRENSLTLEFHSM